MCPGIPSFGVRPTALISPSISGTIFSMGSQASEHLRLGQRYQFAEPPDDHAAEQAYRAAVRAAPEWGEPYHWLASVLERQGNAKEAVEAYQRAIQLLSGDPRPLIALGRLRSACEQYEEAIGLLEAGLAMKPHYAEADARLFLAEALERSGAEEKAVAQWQIVLGMEPSYPSHDKPIEEAKRKLNEHGRQYPLLGDGKLVSAYLKHFETKDDELFWAAAQSISTVRGRAHLLVALRVLCPVPTRLQLLVVS